MNCVFNIGIRNLFGNILYENNNNDRFSYIFNGDTSYRINFIKLRIFENILFNGKGYIFFMPLCLCLFGYVFVFLSKKSEATDALDLCKLASKHI